MPFALRAFLRLLPLDLPGDAKPIGPVAPAGFVILTRADGSIITRADGMIFIKAA